MIPKFNVILIIVSSLNGGIINQWIAPLATSTFHTVNGVCELACAISEVNELVNPDLPEIPGNVLCYACLPQSTIKSQWRPGSATLGSCIPP